MDAHIRFSYFPHMTYVRSLLLKKFFGSLESAWDASAHAFSEAGWPQSIIETYISWRKEFHAQQAQEKLEENNIHAISLIDPTYPTLVHELYDPPLALFVRGDVNSITRPIAVVGSRKYSHYGKFATETLVEALAHQGISIVSGLALGIDSIAHTTTLRAHGHTVAVLGGGIDDATIAPRQHVSLAHNILRSGGVLLSEYPPGVAPTPYSFPKRNRIIAGLSLGVIVMEAGKKSGARITAQCAIDLHRDVCAIPHPITAESGAGCNTLVQQGAHLITSASEILELFHLPDKKICATNKEILPSSNEEILLLQTLSREGMHIDALIKDTALPSTIAMSTLSLMEMKGMVTNLGNNTYIKNQ